MIFLPSWNLFSNSFIKMESMTAYSLLIRALCLASVSKCIQLLAITWGSTAQRWPPYALISVDSALTAHWWFGCSWAVDVCLGCSAGKSCHLYSVGRGADCMQPTGHKLSVPVMYHLEVRILIAQPVNGGGGISSFKYVQINITRSISEWQNSIQCES